MIGKLKWLWTTLVNGWRSSTLQTNRKRWRMRVISVSLRCRQGQAHVKSEDPVNPHSRDRRQPYYLGLKPAALRRAFTSRLYPAQN